MTKSEIKKLLNEPLNDIIKAIKSNDLNIEIKGLDDLKSILDDLSNNVEKRKKSILSKRDRKGNLIWRKCSHCKKYFKVNTKDIFTTESIHCINTYTDSGYGDDDRYADAVYIETKSHCPLCKKEILLDRNYSHVIPGSERDKYGTVCN